jgi:coenzyme Q-binding protein COQ10
MTKYNITRELPYSAKQLLEVALDVGSYKAFVPLVRESTLANRKVEAGGVETFDATLRIMYKKLRIDESLKSRVRVDRPNLMVTATSNEGPVSNLVSVWKIRDLPAGKSEVNYSVDYTLKSRTLHFLLGGMFDLAMRKIMAAFEKRAEQVYGGKAG